MIDINKAWNLLQKSLAKYPKVFELELYYNAKTNEYSAEFQPKIKEQYHIISLGCWSRRADFPRFKLFLTEIKLRHSLYDVSELTDKAKEFVCNGAGPKGLGWTVPDFQFTDAANNHDLMYTVGGDKEAKKWADYCFLWHMRRDGADWLALVYFWAVKLFGKGAFEFRSKKMTVEEINQAFDKETPS